MARIRYEVPGQFEPEKDYGVHKIFNIIKTLDIEHAINAHSPGIDPTDLNENIAFVNEMHDATYAELNVAVQEGGLFTAYEKVQTLPETFALDEYSDWRDMKKISQGMQNA